MLVTGFVIPLSGKQNYYYEILLPHIVKFLIEHSTFLFKDSKIRFL